MDRHEHVFSTQTFRKILVFIVPIIAIFLWQSQIFKEEAPIESDETAVKQEVERTVHRLVETSWDGYWAPILNGMDSVATAIWKNGGAEQSIENWVQSQDQFLSGSVWLRNKKWPVRYTRDSFWKLPSVKSLEGDEQREVFSYFFKEESYQDKQQDKYYIGPVLNHSIESEYPIITIGLVTNAIRDVQMVETKVRCDVLFELLDDKMHDHFEWAITNEKDQCILASSDTLKIYHPQEALFNIVFNHSNIAASLPIKNTGWVFHYQQPRTQVASLTNFRWVEFYVLLGILIAIGLLWAYLLTRWIDRPLNQILLMANEIARGDFSIRIPMPKSKKLKQLAILINYMAEETERLLQMNVGGIISEKRKTETILRNIADGVLVTDPENRIIVINSVAENWFGVKQKMVFEKPLAKTIRIKSFVHLFEKLSFRHQKASIEFNYKIPGENNERIFHAHASQVFDEDKRLIGTVTILRDITKEYEADKLKTELVSMVAHELKSPMTSIFGFSELLMEDDLTNGQRKEYANVIMTESSRLTDLINKFLDLTRLEVGRTEIKMIPFDLSQLVDKMIESTRSLFQKKNIHMIKDVSGKLPFAYGDPDMIEQVMLNLLSNAIKYSPKNSKIGIELKQTDDRLLVSVIDNGYGIPKESLPNIFKKFYRVSDSNDTSSVEGSGLGLALAKEIVQHHGSTIEVQSKLGVGSVFNFTLPKADILEKQNGQNL